MYLVSILTSDGRCGTKIKIGMGKRAFKDLASVLTNRMIKLDTRKRVLNSYVWSILLYGCETWIISKNMEEKLKSIELLSSGVCYKCHGSIDKAMKLF